jgi:predicted glycosyltransferase
MRVWIDLANSPHVPLLEPIVRRLESEGHDVLLTARDHAQTLEMAQSRWPEIQIVGVQSPTGVVPKGLTIARRGKELASFARRMQPTVAFSHGSYAQLVAARIVGVPGVTMMDYEHQPANHLSFRLARRVIVPSVFPDDALRRFGARPKKVLRYPGFKEELYLAAVQPNCAVLSELDLDPTKVIAVFRPPPDGALYHRTGNERFDEVLRLAMGREDVQVVILPRTPEQRRRYGLLSERLCIPTRVVDGSALLAAADVTVGGGGTMNRESAILGTPTYTVFAGRLAAVDVELIRLGRLHDLRSLSSEPAFEKRSANSKAAVVHAEPILMAVLTALSAAAR